MADLFEGLGDESMGPWFASFSPSHEDILQGCALESTASPVAAANVANHSWSNYSPDDDDDYNDGEHAVEDSTTPEGPRLWLSHPNRLNSMTVKVALDSSEALAFTFCESFALSDYRSFYA